MNKKGFTLIELLLYLGLASVMVLVMSAFLFFMMQNRVKSQTMMEVEQQGAVVMQIVSQAVRNASLINSPAIGASASSLSIDTAVVGNNPTVFDLSSGALRIKQGGATAVNLTNSRVVVSALTFQNLGQAGTSGIIRGQFTVSYLNPDNRNIYEYEKTFIFSAAKR